MFIFGSNPDSLSQARTTADQQNIGLALSDQAARQRAIDVGQQRQIQQQQSDQARQDAQFQFAQQQAAQQQSQQQANQENDFRFNIGRQDQAAADAESKRRFNIGAAQTQQQIDSTKGQNDYAEAVSAIENGDVTSLKDLTKSFPNLTPQQQQRGAMYLSMKSQKQGQDYQAVVSAADAATGLVAPKPTQQVIPPGTKWNPANWGASSTTNTIPPVPINEDQAFAALASNPKAKPLGKTLFALAWDDNAQRFVPAIPKPEGWAPTQTLPPIRPPSGAGPALPSMPPTAPNSLAPAPFAFNTAAPQPTTVTAGTQPLAGPSRAPIDAGTVYKGYVFQGGDPADQRNWALVPQTQ